MKLFKQKNKTKKAFIIYLIIGFLLRFTNLQNRLYFIWDQGRDAVMFEKIIHGDLTLIGPTSGLPGFYLGPLWFYAGVPGYLLGGGNPYIISLWYIFLASISLIFFWKISHLLFKDKKWAMINAYLMSLIPGSIAASIFIWNPLLTLPLISIAFYCLLKADKSPKHLLLGILMFALALHAEFAYAVFFMLPLLILTLIISKKKLKTFLAAIGTILVTLLPQIAFEFRNNFLMTKAIIQNTLYTKNTFSWIHLWQKRPKQLFSALQYIFLQNIPHAWFYMTLILILITLISIKIFQNKNNPIKNRYQWRLTVFLSIIPLFFYMLWRGNYGEFFHYYLTPHYIFLIPLLTLALKWIADKIKFKKINISGAEVSALLLGIFFVAVCNYIFGLIIFVENNAGLKKMHQATNQIYEWMAEDKEYPGIIRIFTPNANTENYDHIFKWQAKKRKVDQPLTIKQGDYQRWYLMMEPDPHIPEKRFVPWYEEATEEGKLVRRKQIGVLTLETWEKITE